MSRIPTDEEIRAAVAARPDSETLQQSYAAAAYEAALAAQNAGVPGSIRAGILMAYATAWRETQAALEAVESGVEPTPPL
ncbi:hypothetical protein [Agromyces indicus]|uniref:Uncharacterized protein n=1 Tax=Agromyces indicus TaxID=758919 RepID=A0ABU1FJD8_9MICO|nr:hypothetical protein [Agromyces indicus]MDR5691859.1 hypothetical protein [Agromyces indicus]